MSKHCNLQLSSTDLKGTTTPHVRCSYATRSLKGLHGTLHALPETVTGLDEKPNCLHETIIVRMVCLFLHALISVSI